MEWRQISIRPLSRTGSIKIIKHTTFLKRAYVAKVIPAYTLRDVLDFISQKKLEAIRNRLCTFSEFETENGSLMETMRRISWPLENPDDLGMLWVPISDEQLEFETLKPFLEFGYFSSYSLEQQLLVFKFVDSDTQQKLLSELTKEERLPLFNAIVVKNFEPAE